MKKIKLDKKYIDYLSQSPEQGMGYQKVDISLKSGTKLNNITVLNSDWLILNNSDENFTSDDIKTIKIKEETILYEEINKNIIKISIFDLDGSLINTELPDSGKKIWKQKTNQDWPHKGFWGRIESMSDIFDNKVIPETLDGYKKSITNPNSLTVLMTGRLKKVFENRIHELLKEKGLDKFDKYYFNTGGDTFDIKIKQIEELLTQYPDIQVIEMWEDRESHIKKFKEYFNKNHSDIELIINHIKSGHHESIQEKNNNNLKDINLYEIVNNFRTELEDYYEWKEDKICFKGYCEGISESLVDHLKENGYKKVKKVCGFYNNVPDDYEPITRDWDEKDFEAYEKWKIKYPNVWKHCWVEVNNEYIVDVTSDQFHLGEENAYRINITDINDSDYDSSGINIKEEFMNYNSIQEQKDKKVNHKYEYGALMLSFDIPKWNDKVLSLIEKEDIYDNEEKEYGLEFEPHISLLFGFHDEVKLNDLKNTVNKILKNKDNIKVKLTKISHFSGEEYDVVKFDVDSDLLHEINKELVKYPHTSNFPDYKPHMTISYIKKGKGKKYDRKLKNHAILKGTKMVYSHSNGKKDSWSLDDKEIIKEQFDASKMIPIWAISNHQIEGISERDFINKILKGLKYKPVDKKYQLGSGSMGNAYLIDNGRKVLKLTTDISEAKATNKIVGKNMKYVVNYYSVIKLVSKIIKLPINIYATIMDNVETDYLYFASMFDDMNKVMHPIEGVNYNYQMKKDIKYKNVKALEYYKNIIDNHDNEEEGNNAMELYTFMIDLYSELSKYGIDFEDLHEGNMGIRNGNWVAFDLRGKGGLKVKKRLELKEKHNIQETINYNDILQEQDNNTKYSIPEISWLYFLCFMYGGKMKISSWEKDNRTGVNFQQTMLKFLNDNIIRTDSENYYCLDKGKQIVLDTFYYEDFKDNLNASYKFKQYDIKGYDGYIISNIPYRLWLQIHPNINEEFNKFSDLHADYWNSDPHGMGEPKYLEQMLKIPHIDLYNYKNLFNYFYPDKIPNIITLYRGIKGEYEPRFQRKMFSSWTLSKKEAERFSKYHFVTFAIEKPQESEKQTILKIEISIKDIDIVIGGRESEVILKNPVKNIEVETIKEETILYENIIQEQELLTEDRISDAKKKYPKIKPAWFKWFVKIDPSGNQKYLDWLLKTFDKEYDADKFLPDDLNYFDTMIGVINFFHKNTHKYKKKDINQYKTFEELEEATKEAKIKITKGELERIAKQETTVLLNDDNYFMVIPKSHRANCYYGAGTGWCTTESDPAQFNIAVQKGHFIYVIDKKRKTFIPTEKITGRTIKGTGDRLYKVAIQIPFEVGDDIIIWDSTDTKIYVKEYFKNNKLIVKTLIKNNLLSWSYRKKYDLISKEEMEEIFKKTLKSGNTLAGRLKKFTKLLKTQDIEYIDLEEFFLDKNQFEGKIEFFEDEMKIIVDSEIWKKYYSGLDEDSTWAYSEMNSSEGFREEFDYDELNYVYYFLNEDAIEKIKELMSLLGRKDLISKINEENVIYDFIKTLPDGEDEIQPVLWEINGETSDYLQEELQKEYKEESNFESDWVRDGMEVTLPYKKLILFLSDKPEIKLLSQLKDSYINGNETISLYDSYSDMRGQVGPDGKNAIGREMIYIIDKYIEQIDDMGTEQYYQNYKNFNEIINNLGFNGDMLLHVDRGKWELIFKIENMDYVNNKIEFKLSILDKDRRIKKQTIHRIPIEELGAFITSGHLFYKELNLKEQKVINYNDLLNDKTILYENIVQDNKSKKGAGILSLNIKNYVNSGNIQETDFYQSLKKINQNKFFKKLSISLSKTTGININVSKNDFIGGESYGRVYSVNDKILLKLTEDELEAKAINRIIQRKLKLKTVIDYYFVAMLNTKDLPSNTYVILMEKVKLVTGYFEDLERLLDKIPKNLDRYRYSNVGNIEDDIRDEPIIGGDDIKAREIIKKYGSEKALKLFDFMFKLHKETQKYGLIFRDFHRENLGIKNGRLIAFDLSSYGGLTVRKQLKINENNNVIQEVISDILPKNTDVDEFFKKISKALNVNLNQKNQIGEGTAGYVYKINDKLLLKITYDVDEAKAINKIVGKKLNYVIDYYKIFKLKSKEIPDDDVYIILMENVKTNKSYFKGLFDDLFSSFNKFEQYQYKKSQSFINWEDIEKYMRYGQKNKLLIQFESFINSFINSDKIELQKKGKNALKLYNFMFNLYAELGKYGLNFYDFWEENLGFRDNVKLVAFDITSKGGIKIKQELEINENKQNNQIKYPTISEIINWIKNINSFDEDEDFLNGMSNEILQNFKNLQDEINIYRAIQSEEVDLSDLGNHWGFDLDSVKRFATMNLSGNKKDWKIISAKIDKKYINLKDSIKHYIQFSFGQNQDAENELTIDSDNLSKIKDIKIYRYNDINIEETILYEDILNKSPHKSRQSVVIEKIDQNSGLNIQEQYNHSQMVSAIVKIDNVEGIAVGEIFNRDKNHLIIIDRYYPTINSYDVEVGHLSGKEQVVEIIYDNGQLFDEKSKDIQIEENVLLKEEEADRKILIPGDWKKHFQIEGNNIVLYYYGSLELEGNILDPKFLGQQSYTSDVKQWSQPRLFFYIKPEDKEWRVTGKEYIIKFPLDKLYPFNKDPLNFYEECKKDYNRDYLSTDMQVRCIGQKIKNKGFSGMIYKWEDTFLVTIWEKVKPENIKETILYENIQKEDIVIKEQYKQSPFYQDMISIMKKILKDLYENTEYWGLSEHGVEGIIKPITPEDDNSWSNYNFINTNSSAIWKVIDPHMKELFKSGKYKIEGCLNFPIPNKNKGIDEFGPEDYNPNKCWFDLMWLMREELYGLNSSIKDDIMGVINITRGKGSRLENYLVMSLNDSGITNDAEIAGGSGKPSDFQGTDVTFTLNDQKQETQVKSLIDIFKSDDGYLIKSIMLNRIYPQDILILSKEIEQDKIYEFYIFNNPKKNIKKTGPNEHMIDKSYLLYVLKYDNGKVQSKKINESVDLKLEEQNQNIIYLNDGQIKYYNSIWNNMDLKYTNNKFYKSIIKQLNEKRYLTRKQKYYLDYLFQHGQSPYEGDPLLLEEQQENKKIEKSKIFRDKGMLKEQYNNDTVSVILQLNNNKGYGVGEVYNKNKNSLITFDRYYPDIDSYEVEKGHLSGQEKIIDIIYDNGKLFDEKTKSIQIVENKSNNDQINIINKFRNKWNQFIKKYPYLGTIFIPKNLKFYDKVEHNIKGCRDRKCYLHAWKDVPHPMVIGVIFDKEPVINWTTEKQEGFPAPIPHSWNIKNGKIYDVTLGSYLARKYFYFGIEITEKLRNKFKDSEEIAKYVWSKLEKYSINEQQKTRSIQIVENKLIKEKKKRVFIIHGWDGSPDKNWFPWIKKQLKEKGFDVYVLKMPNPDKPIIKDWVNTLKENIDNPDENTYFIGHSMGVQTILRYLETLDKNTKIGGLITVAGFFNLPYLKTKKEKEIAKPWLDIPINTNKIKNFTNNIISIFSDNDPDVSLYEIKIFKEKLGSKIIIQKNKEHFTNDKIPIVLKELLKITKEDTILYENILKEETIKYINWNDLNDRGKEDIIENIYDNSKYLQKEWNIWTFKEYIDNEIDLKIPLKYYSVDELWKDSLKQNRGYSEENIERLKQILHEKGELDPVLINKGKFSDGGHRLRIYKEEGIKEIPGYDIGFLLKIDWEKWSENPEYKLKENTILYEHILKEDIDSFGSNLVPSTGNDNSVEFSHRLLGKTDSFKYDNDDTIDYNIKENTEKLTYIEIEFVCHNSETKNSTDRKKQKELFTKLKELSKQYPILPYMQDFSDENHKEISLAVIILDKNKEKELLSLIETISKHYNVKIDLINNLTNKQVDGIVRGDYYNNIIIENTIQEEIKSENITL